jgi:hypothetical protein
MYFSLLPKRRFEGKVVLPNVDGLRFFLSSKSTRTRSKKDFVGVISLTFIVAFFGPIAQPPALDTSLGGTAYGSAPTSLLLLADFVFA